MSNLDKIMILITDIGFKKDINSINKNAYICKKDGNEYKIIISDDYKLITLDEITLDEFHTTGSVEIEDSELLEGIINFLKLIFSKELRLKKIEKLLDNE